MTVKVTRGEMFITHLLYPLSLRRFPTPLNYESHKFALASRQQYGFETELLILNPGTVTGYYLPTSMCIYICIYIKIYRSVSPYNVRTIRAEYATVVFACTTLPPKPPPPTPNVRPPLQNVKSLTRKINCIGARGVRYEGQGLPKWVTSMAYPQQHESLMIAVF